MNTRTVWASATLAAILAVFSPICSAEDKFAAYEKNGIQISYPSSWKLQELPIPGAAFLSPREGAEDIFQENVNVLVQDLSASPMTLADYTALTKNQIEKLIPESKILSMETTTWAGQEAGKVVYLGRQAQTSLKLMQVWIIRDNKAYLGTYTAEEEKYKKFLPEAEKIMNSFKAAS